MHRERGNPGAGDNLEFTVRPFAGPGRPGVNLKSFSVADFDADLGATASTHETKNPGKRIEGGERGYCNGA